MRINFGINATYVGECFLTKATIMGILTHIQTPSLLSAKHVVRVIPLRAVLEDMYRAVQQSQTNSNATYAKRRLLLKLDCRIIPKECMGRKIQTKFAYVGKNFHGDLLSQGTRAHVEYCYGIRYNSSVS